MTFWDWILAIGLAFAICTTYVAVAAVRVASMRRRIEREIRDNRGKDVWCPTCKHVFRKPQGWLVSHVSTCRGPGKTGERVW